MLILQNNFPFCFSHAKSACTYYQIKKEAYFFFKKTGMNMILYLHAMQSNSWFYMLFVLCPP